MDALQNIAEILWQLVKLIFSGSLTLQGYVVVLLMIVAIMIFFHLFLKLITLENYRKISVSKLIEKIRITHHNVLQLNKRLDGITRLAILLSLIWSVGIGIYTYIDYLNIRQTGDEVAFVKPVDEKIISKETFLYLRYSIYRRSITFSEARMPPQHFIDIKTLNFLLMLIGPMILVWVLIYGIKWVTRGFKNRD